MNDLFRKKNLDRIASPEQLDEYIRVTTPSVWLVLLAVVILLAGILIWSCFGVVEVEKADGTTVPEHPITFVTN